MRLKIIGGTGLTSCLSVRLHDVTQYINKHKEFPTEIDSSEQFKLYRDNEEDVSRVLLKDYYYTNIDYVSGYNHGWQYGFADEISIEKLSPYALTVCPPSDLVYQVTEIYKSILGNRTAVLYRGNDKALEIPRTPYAAMEEMALDSKETRFLVQTDEQEFYDYFKERFPDTICFEDIPRISKNPDSYVITEIGQRLNFAINFMAALIAISSAKKLIINTGNTGLWTTIFRGHINGIYQYHGGQSKWKKF